MNPYRLPRILAFIAAVACSVTTLGLVVGERADLEGLGWDEHPVLLLVGVVGTAAAVQLYRWLYGKEDRWELADVPGWEEEVQAQVSEQPSTPPVDFWGRFWPAFFAVMLPPVGVILSILAVRKAETPDRAWAVGSLSVACLLTALPIIALIQR